VTQVRDLNHRAVGRERTRGDFKPRVLEDKLNASQVHGNLTTRSWFNRKSSRGELGSHPNQCFVHGVIGGLLSTHLNIRSVSDVRDEQENERHDRK